MIGPVRSETVTEGLKVVFKRFHYHATSIPRAFSRVEMKPFEVTGTDRYTKKPIYKRGIFCPKCFLTI